MWSFITGGNSANQVERERINELIKSFTAKAEELTQLDKKIGVAISIDLALCVSSALNGMIGILALAGIVYWGMQHSQRPNLKKEFDVLLGQMHEAYQWCAKVGPTVTNDEMVQSLVKHLLPYSADPFELLPWEASQFNEISPTFLKLFADSPHRMIIVTPNAMIKSNSANEATSFGWFFTRVKDEAGLALYKRKFNGQAEVPKLQLPQLQLK